MRGRPSQASVCPPGCHNEWSALYPGVHHYHPLLICITALGRIIPLTGNFPCLICIQRERKDKDQRKNIPCFVARWEDGCVCVFNMQTKKINGIGLPHR